MAEGEGFTCLDCRYALDGLDLIRGRLRCPECGTTWSIPQLQSLAQQKVYWGAYPWLLLCGIAVFAGADYAFRSPFNTSTLGASMTLFLWNWACTARWLVRNTSLRFESFSYVVGVLLGFILACVLTIVLGIPGNFLSLLIP
jgi:hypothetical protein